MLDYYIAEDVETMEDLYHGEQVILTETSMEYAIYRIMDYASATKLALEIHYSERVEIVNSDTCHITGECDVMAKDGSGGFIITFFKNQLGSTLYLFEPRHIDCQPDTIVAITY